MSFSRFVWPGVGQVVNLRAIVNRALAGWQPAAGCQPAPHKKRAMASVLVAFLLLTGCGTHDQPNVQAAAQSPVAVQTVTVEAVDWPVVYEATGTVRARTSARVAARVMGYITEMPVRAGDTVRAGQLIATIDARELEAGSQQAQAALEEARSGIAEADNGVAAAKAQLDFAQVTFRRMEDLFQKKSISNHEYDDARAKLNVAHAGHAMAQAKRAQLDARIRQAEQAVRASEVTRSHSRVHAPFAGVVTEKHLEQGSMATPGAPLVTIEQAGGYQLEVPVEEARLASVRIGQAVSVRLDAFDQTVAGKVAEVVPAIDPATRTFLAKLALPSDHRLRSGLFGRAQFALNGERVVAVPASAVVERGQLRTVYVVEGDTARARLVTIGRRRDRNVEVLSGLSAGEKVVSNIPARLTDGAKVQAQS